MSCAAVSTPDYPAESAAPERSGEAGSVASGFAALGLHDSLVDAVAALGYTEPTAIQARAIPALLAGRDVTGVAQTGTGKTAAFGLPLLAAVDPAAAGVQALVLTPTRELALQVARALGGFAAGMPGLEVAVVYGGAPMGPQLAALRRGAQVVVGTPGRIIDHLERGSLTLDAVRFAVLDEADEMLRMGFAEDVDRILSDAPADRQTALFSATMPSAIRRAAAQHLRRAVDVSVTPSATPVGAIRQRYAVLPFRQKVDALVRILALRGAAAPGAHPGAAVDDGATVVFVRTRSACEQVGTELAERGVSAAVVSGDVAQRERERTIARLRGGQVDVLVATDVAARGLDIDRIGMVVNFDAPSDAETYVHRIGRTGRAGRSGEALLFVTPRELPRLHMIERATGRRLEQMTPPTPAEVTAHRAAARLRDAAARAQAGRLDACRTAVAAAAAETGLEVTELAAALLAVAVGDDGAVPTSGRREAPAGREVREARERAGRVGRGEHDARRESPGHRARDEWDERTEREHDDRTERRERDAAPHSGKQAKRGAAPVRNDSDAVRYVVQVGRRHGVRPAGIVGAITGEGGLAGADVGRIDIFDQYSVVEIARPVGADALARIRHATVSGRQLWIRPDRPSGRGGLPAAPRPRRGTAQHRDQNRAGWTPGAGARPRGGRLPSGKRDSALPGTPRTS